MRNRNFWFQKIETAWKHGNTVWLAGVRRSGKSSLVQLLPQVELLDCTNSATRRQLDHPLEVLSRIGEGRLALDEINRLVNPFELLALIRQHFPGIEVIATSSAPLALCAGDRDITDLKLAEIWLTPMVSADLADFRQADLQRRFIRGGLPPFFLADAFPERDFQSWMDDFWLNAVQENFRLEKRASFQKFTEEIFTNSGEIFEATKFVTQCGVSRTTITNYLSVLEQTFAANILRPFNSRRSTEIIAAPRVYGFDTGFVAFNKGWDQLRRSDFGPMWKHFVLNELHASLQSRQFYYWKDKRGHQVDFVFARRIHTPTAIACSWSSSDFDPSGLQAFRRQYPHGENIVVCHDVTQHHIRTFREVTAKFVPLHQLLEELLTA